MAFLPGLSQPNRGGSIVGAPDSTIDWSDPSFGQTGQGYNADPSQVPTPYANPSPGAYGGAPLGPTDFPTGPAPGSPTGWGSTDAGGTVVGGNPWGGTGGASNPWGGPSTGGGTAGGARPQARDVAYDPTRGWLNDPLNPNLNSGDLQRINRGGPGFFGNGEYMNDPSAFRLPQADAMRQAYQQMFQGATGPADPSSLRGQQQQLAGNLFGTLNGTQPSVAQQQLKQTTQGNVANAYAMAQSGRYNPAAARMAADNVGALNQQAAGQGALLRAGEIQGAQGQLGGLLGNARQQDTEQALRSMQGLGGINQAMLNARENQESQQQNAYYGTAGHAIGGQLLGGLTSGGSAALGTLAAAHGGPVPGRAKGGDSAKNDTVPAMLSPGEVVLPRSVTKADDAPDKAKAFVEAIRRKHQLKKAA